MRLVEWKDAKGWFHRSLLRDNDPNERAPQGVPAGVPDLEKLNWKEIKRELNNELHRRKLFTFDDVEEQQKGITGAVLAVFRRRILRLYREPDSRR